MNNNKRTLHMAVFVLVQIVVLMLVASCRAAEPAPAAPPVSAQEGEEIDNVEVEKKDEESAAQSTEPTAEPAPDTAKYRVLFTATWSADTHPGFYDPAAHFSPFIAYSHHGEPQAQIFTTGSPSSPGMEQMAETGATALLEGEISDLASGGNALAFAKGPVFDSPGEAQAELDFTQAYNHVTFVSMIAPSPDWFVAAQAALLVDGQWMDELVVELVSYDAGTDSGPELTSADADTNPKASIVVLPNNLQKMGTLTLTRVLP